MSIAEPEVQVHSAAPPAEPGPLFKRIVEAFTSPGQLFARMPESGAPWVDVALITAVVLAVSMLLIPTEAFTEMMREQIRNMPTQPGQRAPDPATIAGFAKFGGAVTMLLYPFIGAVVVGGLLKLVMGAMGGDATYGQYLSVYSHAVLVFALGSLITLPIIIASGDVMRQLNLALLLGDADRSSFLFKFLMQFGIFNLWQYAVIAVGAQAVNRGRVSAGAAWGGVGAIYLATAILGAVMQRT